MRQRFLRLIFHPGRLLGVIGRHFKAMYSKELVKKEWDKLRERKYEKWEKFCRQNINVTEPVLETKLSQYMNCFDIMVTGSDQVWNPKCCTEYTTRS